MPDELKTAERLMETAPDSSLHILQSMSPDKYKSASNRALYGLLFIRALNKNLLPLKPDSLLDFSIRYYLAHGDDEHLASCYLYKGREYKLALKYEKAMEFFLKGLDIAQTKNYTLLLARINIDLGDIYLQQKDYNLSRQKYKLAYMYFISVKMQDLAFYSLLNIGRTYHHARDYKNAQSYYRKINRYTKDSLQKASLLQEMAINFYDDHKFDSAKVYFLQVIRSLYWKQPRSPVLLFCRPSFRFKKT
jgi:tetratricopeptide (TPR) repeat protein